MPTAAWGPPREVTIAAIVELPRRSPWLEEDARSSLGGTSTCSAKSKRESGTIKGVEADSDDSRKREEGREQRVVRTGEMRFGGEGFAAGQEPCRVEVAVEEGGGFGG